MNSFREMFEAKKFEVNKKWSLTYFNKNKETSVEGTEKEILKQFNLPDRIDYRDSFISYLNKNIKSGHFQNYKNIKD